MLDKFSNLIFNIHENLSLKEKAKTLFQQQIENWKLAKSGYDSLKFIQKKVFQFEDFTIEAHFNPGRIISSSAKVDEKSIQERPCFLCVENLPQDQKAIKINENYLLLINPFPIFDIHFTIPFIYHIPQTIKESFVDLLKISKLLREEFTVFYNGPKCGASAPDHLHFQAGNFGFMKLDEEFYKIINKHGILINDANEFTTTAVVNGLRNFITIESNDLNSLAGEFERIYNVLSVNHNEEPMLNIICYYKDFWKVVIFPRKKHRPTYFFEEGENKILISPAAVDMGGILIFPREEDFNKITKELIVDIFNQVTFTNEEFFTITEKLKV